MRALAWGLISSVGFVGLPYVILWPIVQIELVIGATHDLARALFVGVWVLASGAWTLAAARLAFRNWLPTTRPAVVMLLVGAIVAACHIGVLTVWTVGRYGRLEWDFVGPTAWLYAAVAAVAVAGFGVQVAPRPAVWYPLACVVLGAALTLTTIVANLPGLADGLSPDSGGLALATGVSGAYVLIVGVLSFRRAWHRRTLEA